MFKTSSSEFSRYAVISLHANSNAERPVKNDSAIPNGGKVQYRSA